MDCTLTCCRGGCRVGNSARRERESGSSKVASLSANDWGGAHFMGRILCRRSATAVNLSGRPSFFFFDVEGLIEDLQGRAR